MIHASGDIFVVDDDRAVRDMLSIVLTTAGYRVICFADGTSLLAVARTQCPDCILLDVQIPGKSGIDVLKELRAQDYPAPILMISGHGDIATAVEAVKRGAFDFIEKPLFGKDLVVRVDNAIKAFEEREAAARVTTLQPREHEALTSRETEVFGMLSSGATNKNVARQLTLSVRTVEYHRANIMKKLGVSNAAGLMRSAFSVSANGEAPSAAPIRLRSTASALRRLRRG